MPHRKGGEQSPCSQSAGHASPLRPQAGSEDLPALSAALRDMSSKFLAAEEWLGQVAERVQRLEAVLFRTSVSDFLQIDKVIDEIVQKTHVAVDVKAELSELQVCDESQFGEGASVVKDSADDLFCTARDVGDDLAASGPVAGSPVRPEVCREHQSKLQRICALSTGCISTDVGETSTDISVGNSSNIEQSRHSDGALRRVPSTRGAKTDHQHQMADGGECCELEDGAGGDVRADIFQEIDQWSAPSSMLDPTWTEPVPRGLEVVDEASAPGHASGSATPTDGCWAFEPECTEFPTADWEPAQPGGHGVCNDRTPSPERQHNSVEESIDDRGRMIAHLIAENARLQALVQSQFAIPSTCSSPVGGAEEDAPERAEACSGAEQVRLKLRKLSKKERARRQRRALAETAPQAEPP
uniref:Uncharacterized protein n=1 Tax=Alexandrium monilatum TaxID=311494 RepID=A0A6T1EMP6_9DINO|mmetsp:Transcript_19278/g.57906  ORF Transcript_19278/g.57906 Transcript_19278/m.57906 type:complete len:413 (+) Transcript_19278:69-1307(+)